MFLRHPKQNDSSLTFSKSLLYVWFSDVQSLVVKQNFFVWHPSEPGTKVCVTRNFWQKILYPTYFAIESELKESNIQSQSNHEE